MTVKELQAFFAAEDAEAARAERREDGRWTADAKRAQDAKRRQLRSEAREAKRFPIVDAVDVFIDADPLY